MTTYDFIFSNQLRHRFSRHVLFWLCWFVFFQLTYHYPTNIFPDWDIRAKMEQATKKFGVDYVTLRGGWLNMIWEITYRQSSLLLCHIALTYAVIYYILPRYISRSKKWVTTTGILLLAIAAFFILHYFFVYITSLDVNNTKIKLGRSQHITKLNNPLLLARTMGTITFNLVTVVGIAVVIKLLKRWWLKQKETVQIANEKAAAELQLLKAQIHPHFLFNSLNNIYSFALEGSPGAPEMIQKLSGLLHYMLSGCKQPLVPLEKELKMITDYISLEKIRYGDRLKIDIQIKLDGNSPMIAPLLLIPFVENSFKHGTSKMLDRPFVMLSITVQNDILYFTLSNSRPSGIEDISVNGNRGLGLKNVKKRLALIYPGRHELQITDESSFYTASLEIALVETVPGKLKDVSKKEIPSYELA